MSGRLLYVTASPRNDLSEGTRVADALIERRLEIHPDETVDRLDLWANPVPTFGAEHVAAKMAVIAGKPPAEATRAWDEVHEAAQRVLDADRVVIACPVWNGGIPWILKHWIDTVTQPGLLFRFDPTTGYHGLARGRRAAVVYSSSVYADGRTAAFGRDFHRAYLEDWLQLVGIDLVGSVALWRTRPDEDLPERRARARQEAVLLAERL